MRFQFVISLFFMAIVTSYGQSDSIQARLSLQEVVINDLRHRYSLETLDRQITIIHKDEIAQAPVQSVSELLQYVGGVDVRHRGVMGMQSDISIRGGTFDQTLILIDGLRVADPQTGHHNMNLPIDIAAIERIEIVKGAGARHYGINAAAGAINIVTKQPGKDYVQAQLARGSFAYNGWSGAASMGRGKQRYFVSARHDASEGYRYNTAFGSTAGFARATLSLNNSVVPQIHLTAGALYRQFGANGFYGSPSAKEQYEETETHIAAVKLPMSLRRWTIVPRGYWRRGFDSYKYDRVTNLYNNRHLTQIVGSDIQGQLAVSERFFLGLGFDIHRAQIFSSNLGNRERTTSSLYTDLQYRWRRFGAMINSTILHTTDFGFARAGYLPLIGYELGYSLTPALRIGVSGGGTYRVPTFTDQYYSDPAHQGNPNLSPEFAAHTEGYIRYAAYGGYLSAAVFQRRVNNQIDWVRNSEAEKWRSDNLHAVQTTGFEAQGQLRIAQLVERKRLFIQQVRIGYTHLDTHVKTTQTGIESRYVAQQLRHQVIQSAVFRLPGNLFIDARHRYVQRAAQQDLPRGYHVFDMRLSADYKLLHFFIEGRNLTGTEYWEVNHVPMPTRNWLGGITLRLGRVL